MKKKILLIALVLMVIAVSGVFATGVGIQGGLDFIAGTAYGSDLALSLKLDDLPFMLGLGWDFSSGVVIGATADWWMYETNLISIIDLYMGPGIFGGFSTVSGEIWLGPRMAAGLQVFFIEPLELFIELDPYLTLLPSIGFGLQGAAGVRSGSEQETGKNLIHNPPFRRVFLFKGGNIADSTMEVKQV